MKIGFIGLGIMGTPMAQHLLAAGHEMFVRTRSKVPDALKAATVCASNADAFMPSPNQFSYFQGGGFDMCFLSFMEVDVEGNVNVSKLAKKPYLTAGCGGFVDITAHAKEIVFSGWFEAGAEIALSDEGVKVVRPGKFTKMVDKVEHVTFSGKRAVAQGQKVLYVTERCVIRLTSDGLVATEIMPGIEAERDIVAASQGRVKVAENAVVMPLSLLKQGPMGWRP